MRCLACGNEMGERNICQVCGTPKKNVLCNTDVISMDPGTEVMYENMRHYDGAPKKEVSQKEKDLTDVVMEEEASVIPDCNEIKEKNKHSGKRTKLKIILFVLLGLTITISTVIVFLFINKEKKYLEGLPAYTMTFYDTKRDIMYDQDGQPLYYGKNNYKYSSISDNYTRLFYLNDRKLVNRVNDVDKIIDEKVVAYIGDSNWDYILYAKFEEQGISVILQNEATKLSVMDGLYNIDNLVVSENGEYFAFRTTWTYSQWVKDSQLPGGGEYVTVTVTELYSVNKVGDYKLRIQSEDDVKCNYITNTGELIYSDYTTNEMCVEASGTTSSIYSAVEDIIYNENLNCAILISTMGDLSYWVRNEEVLTLISSGIEELYYIDSHKGFCELVGSKNTVSTKTDVMCVFYAKGSNKYFIDLDNMSEATIVTNEELEFNKIKLIGTDSFYYLDEKVMLYQLEDGKWSKEETELLYHNQCGRGYLTYNNGSISYNYKNKSEVICQGDEVLAFVGEWIFYRLGNDVYKININGETEAELLFNNIVEVQVHYK